MLNKAIMFMGLLFVSFPVWLPNILAGSTCCQNVKKEQDLTYERMCGCPGYKLQFQGGNINDYVKVTGVPNMTAITTCFWVNTTQSSGDPAIVSYAAGEQENAFLIYNNNVARKLIVRVTEKSQLPAIGFATSSNIQLNDGKWHHVCVTWQSQDGKYSVYKDGNRIKTEGTVTGTIGKTIPGGGILVLGQDQDSLEGGFELRNAFEGEMAELNIWDSVLSSAKILEMSKSCRPNILAQGNVKTWSQFESGIAGGVTKLKSTCCNLDN